MLSVVNNGGFNNTEKTNN